MELRKLENLIQNIRAIACLKLKDGFKIEVTFKQDNEKNAFVKMSKGGFQVNAIFSSDELIEVIQDRLIDMSLSINEFLDLPDYHKKGVMKEIQKQKEAKNLSDFDAGDLQKEIVSMILRG